MRQLSVVFALLLLYGCGGSGGTGGMDPPDNPPDPPPVEDASVVVVDGNRQGGTDIGQTFALHLRNDGGPGVYAVEAYGIPTSPNGPDTFFGRTEPVDVQADYDETVSYTVSGGGGPPVGWVLIFTRNAGSAQYRQTDRFDFPTLTVRLPGTLRTQD